MRAAAVVAGTPHGLLDQVAAVADPARGAAQVLGSVNPEIVVKNPVPGFVGKALQFGFNLPSAVQAGLAVVGAIIGLTVVYQAWKHRAQVRAWLDTRSRGYKMGLAAMAGFMVIGGGSAAYAGNHYMEHNNDFCMSCHVMGNAWTAFQQSEHRKLECHQCHRQSELANARQLYYWIAERPTDIPPHAKIPTKICAECHIQSRADSNWKRIIRTAGHRLHLENDSSALTHVQCVTCHGQEVHRFKPVDKTCGQSGCHQPKDTKITLGAMAGQTSQHCTGCHTFTRVVPENISMDSTRQYLKPTGAPTSCLGCHTMQDRLKGFRAEDDKGHQGVCGTCHNPHQQTTTTQAYQSCATGGCHQDLASKVPFHAKGGKHASPACGQCHQAHSWKALGTQCIDCHRNILSNDARPVRANQKPNSGNADDGSWNDGSLNDDNGAGAALRLTARRADRSLRRGRVVRGARVLRTALFRHAAFQPRPRVTGAAPGTPKDTRTFSHRTHKVLACGGCHANDGATLTVRTRADCASCHHAADRPTACEGCHSLRAQLDKAIPTTLTMHTSQNTPVRTRTVDFTHRNHRDLECKGCHTSGVMLGVSRACTSCHTEHHHPERICSSCHTPAKSLHVRASHDGCAGAGCHSNADVLALTPSRTTCLVCHTDQVQHKPKRECAECHAVNWTSTPRGSR